MIGISALALVAPLAGAATDTSGCTVKTTQALAIDDYYVVGTAAEFWQETNGVEGLQRSASPCLGRASIPADTCITHRENGALIACLSTYPSSLAP